MFAQPQKRYQVFVSSTFNDLQHERQEVMHALLELDCIPCGMELFPAADDSQWELIKKVIDDCDYYLLIVGGRYGSLADDGLSYTEKEYDYAISQKKPTIAFLHKEPGSIAVSKSEQTDVGKEKLQAFRKKVEVKLCKHWVDAKDLGSVVSRSLVQLIKARPAVGWIRANYVSPETSVELLNLQKENENLRNALQKSQSTPPKDAEQFAQGDESHTFHFDFEATSYASFDTDKGTEDFDATWNEIFSVVGPLMIDECSEFQFQTALNEWIEAVQLTRLTKQAKYRNCEFEVNISNEDFQTIKIQLRALGLIAKNQKSRSVRDTQTYWTLTPYGDETLTKLRAIRRKAVDDEVEF